MPFTPLHLGPALFFGFLLQRYIHFSTFLIANVIIDIEPFLVLFLSLNYPLHGFFHSFLGGSLVAVILSLLMAKIKEIVQNQKIPKGDIWLAAFSGIYLHILLDSPLYTDIKPFYPFTGNPFYRINLGKGLIISDAEIYFLCILLFIAGLFCITIKSLKKSQAF